jgi:hypothetical protein
MVQSKPAKKRASSRKRTKTGKNTSIVVEEEQPSPERFHRTKGISKADNETIKRSLRSDKEA